MALDTITFKLGEDTDTDIREVKGYRYALNCKNGTSDESNVGAIENIMGNTKIESYLPVPYYIGNNLVTSGNYTCIGGCEDLENNAYIYFLYNDMGNHRVVRYFILTGVVERILVQATPHPAGYYFEADLNFSLLHKIRGANVVQGMLYWTDNYNPPRKINISKAQICTATGGGSPLGYRKITDQLLDVIKYPPLKSPTINYFDDTTINLNLLRGAQWQFAYKYIYDDYEKSVLSPTSKVSKPLDDEQSNGNWTLIPYKNNCIQVNINTGAEIVTKIEIYARGNSATEDANPVTVSCNNSEWFLVETLDKYGNTPIASDISYTYNFYNNKVRLSSDQTDMVRLFDYVPQITGAQELIEKNRLLYADITEGYDNVKTQVTLQPDFLRITTPQPLITFNTNSNPSSTAQEQARQHGYLPMQPTFDPPVIGNYYTLTFYLSGGGTRSVSVTATTTNITDLANSLIAAVNSSFGGASSVLTNLFYANGITCLVFNVSGMSISYTMVALSEYEASALAKTSSFKTGAYHNLGIIYYDRALRSGAVNECNPVYIPYYTETPRHMNNDYRVAIHYNVSHKPPDWATHWQWAYSKNTSISEFLQFYISSIADVPLSGQTIVDVNTGIISWNTANPKCIIGTYIWKKGDRMRFITTPTVPNTVTTYIDKEIIGVGATWVILEQFDWATAGIGVNSLIEIYTPALKVSENIYYEIGECYEVGDAGLSTRYHKNASGWLNDGDVYVRNRYTDAFGFVCEDVNWSDWYISDSCNIGRPNAAISTMKRMRLQSNLRFGGQLVQDTRINNLSRFDALDYISLPDKFGAICKLKEVGNVVKVVQAKKVSSIYVGIQSTGEADGTSNLYITNKVLGTVRIPNENYGSIHPDSVICANRALYYYDVYNYCAVRDAANGSEPISNYGKIGYFTQLSDRILNCVPDTLNITAEFDYTTFQYIFSYSFDEIDTLQNTVKISDTIAFNELKNFWDTHYSFVPEHLGCVGGSLISFLNGQLWLHHSNSRYGMFYDKKYPTQIKFVCNVEPLKIKNFLAMGYYSNHKWYAVDITIPPCDSYPNGMKSRLKENKFVLKEGVYYAEFMKDMLTPLFGDDLDALLNGRNLRGQAIEITLETLNDDLTYLYAATVNAIPSERSAQ